jgi:hypothetical protein
VDNVQARFDIAEMLKTMSKQRRANRDEPKYWLDFGNSQHTGQVILSTIGEIKQPNSENMKRWQACHLLPMNLANC